MVIKIGLTFCHYHYLMSYVYMTEIKELVDRVQRDPFKCIMFKADRLGFFGQRFLMYNVDVHVDRMNGTGKFSYNGETYMFTWTVDHVTNTADEYIIWHEPENRNSKIGCRKKSIFGLFRNFRFTR
jgi:hypothetical protein